MQVFGDFGEDFGGNSARSGNRLHFCGLTLFVNRLSVLSCFSAASRRSHLLQTDFSSNFAPAPLSGLHWPVIIYWPMVSRHRRKEGREGGREATRVESGPVNGKKENCWVDFALWTKLWSFLSLFRRREASFLFWVVKQKSEQCTDCGCEFGVFQGNRLTSPRSRRYSFILFIPAAPRIGKLWGTRIWDSITFVFLTATFGGSFILPKEWSYGGRGHCPGGDTTGGSERHHPRTDRFRGIFERVVPQRGWRPSGQDVSREEKPITAQLLQAGRKQQGVQWRHQKNYM